MELAGIFGWDIDFALDIRKGDSFKNPSIRKKSLKARLLVVVKSLQPYLPIKEIPSKQFLMTPLVIIMTKMGRAMKKAFLRSPLTFAEYPQTLTQ